MLYPTDFAKLVNQLKQDEGFRSHLYKCTAGKDTIGYGLNIEAGITKEEAALILEHRVHKLHETLSQYDWYKNLDDTRKTAIINMAYQLGVGGMLKFKKMIAALELREWTEAAAQMMDSRWFKQTESRVRRVMHIIETGQYRGDQ